MSLNSVSLLMFSILINLFWMGVFLIASYHFSFRLYLKRKLMKLGILVAAMVMLGSVVAAPFQSALTLHFNQRVFVVKYQEKIGSWSRKVFVLPYSSKISIEGSTLTAKYRFFGPFNLKENLRGEVKSFKVLSVEPIEETLNKIK